MFSILIPLYNGVEYLTESVKSVKEQTYEGWEIIIGVNGHPEDSDVMKHAYTFQNDKIQVKHYITKGKPNTLNEMVKDTKYDLKSVKNKTYYLIRYSNLQIFRYILTHCKIRQGNTVSY